MKTESRTDSTYNQSAEKVLPIAQKLREASQILGSSAADARRAALLRVMEQLQAYRDQILAANEEDCRRARENKLAAPLLKRLRLDNEGLATLCQSIQTIADLPDPLNHTLESRQLDENLMLHRRTVPLGVIGFIFESRPDALVQIATLALKSGNCAVLKGGSEARASNHILAEIIREAAAQESTIPAHWLALLNSRHAVQELLKLEAYVDLIIPRGSNQFVRHVMHQSAIPVLGHADGICHLYIDKTANPEMAVRLAIDSKTQYVAVCNSVETILIHTDIASEILPQLANALQQRGVEIRGCANSRTIVPNIEVATTEDWESEYLDTIVAVRIVKNLEEAVAHINRYGSHHTDTIVSADQERANDFMQQVDSASVIHNASTRFADGYRYGLGAEIGIATGRLHARGPVGLQGLVSYKWYLYGNGQIVADYVGQNARPFLHRDIRE